MPNYPEPSNQWLLQRIAKLAEDAQALKAQSTQYVIDNKEVCQAIIGNVTHDQHGNPTGLTGWGIASFKTGAWVKL